MLIGAIVSAIQPIALDLPADLTQEAAGFHLPALTLPQAPQAHRRPELKRSRLLAASNLQGLAKGLLCRNELFRMARQEQLSLQSVQLGLMVPLTGLPRRDHCLRQEALRLVRLSSLPIGFGEQR